MDYPTIPGMYQTSFVVLSISLESDSTVNHMSNDCIVNCTVSIHHELQIKLSGSAASRYITS